MNIEDLKQIADLLPTLAKYPTNYQAKSLAQQIQRMLNNNHNNRFKAVKNSNGGILAPAPKTQTQLIEDKRVSLMEAKKLRDEIVNENYDDNSDNNELNLIENKTKKRSSRKNIDSYSAEENV